MTATERVGTSIRRRRALGWVVPVATLMIWELAARTGHAADYLSAPSKISSATIAALLNGSLLANTAASLWRVFAGFALGLGFGVAVGLIAGVWRFGARFINPLISLTYPIPKIAFLPIIIIWLGLGDASKIAIIALSVFFPTFINAYGGASDLNHRYLWAARSMGASPLRIFLRVILPASLPQIFAGARVGLGVAFITLFATELFGARSGLGYLIGLAEDGRRFELMYAAIITIGLAGFLADRLLLAVRARLLRGTVIGKEPDFFG